MVTKSIDRKVGTKAKHNRYENDGCNSRLGKYENHWFEGRGEKKLQ